MPPEAEPTDASAPARLGSRCAGPTPRVATAAGPPEERWTVAPGSPHMRTTPGVAPREHFTSHPLAPSYWGYRPAGGCMGLVGRHSLRLGEPPPCPECSCCLVSDLRRAPRPSSLLKLSGSVVRDQAGRPVDRGAPLGSGSSRPPVQPWGSLRPGSGRPPHGPLPPNPSCSLALGLLPRTGHSPGWTDTTFPIWISWVGREGGEGQGRGKTSESCRPSAPRSPAYVTFWGHWL